MRVRGFKERQRVGAGDRSGIVRRGEMNQEDWERRKQQMLMPRNKRGWGTPNTPTPLRNMEVLN